VQFYPFQPIQFMDGLLAPPPGFVLSGAAPSVTSGIAFSSTTDASSHNHGSFTIAADEVAVIGVIGRATASRTLGAATLGGSALAELSNVDVDATANGTQMAWLIGSLGQTGTLIIPWSGTIVRTGGLVWAVKNLDSLAAFDVSTVAATTTVIDVNTDGAVFALGLRTTDVDIVWSAGVTEDAETLAFESYHVSGGHYLGGPETNRTVSHNGSAAISVLSLS
jgi:hypothetical protein